MGAPGKAGSRHSRERAKRHADEDKDKEADVTLGPHEASIARAQDSANPTDRSSYFEERYEPPDSESESDDNAAEVHDVKKKTNTDEREGPSYYPRNWVFENGAWLNEMTGQRRENNRPQFLGHV